MKEMQLLFTIYDNIYQLFDDIVHSDNIKLLSYFPKNDGPWQDSKDSKYILYYSVNKDGFKLLFKCIVKNDIIEEQLLDSYDKRSLTED